MNLIVLQRQQSNMLDLLSTNKENLPLELPSNNKNQQFNQIKHLQHVREVCGHMMHWRQQWVLSKGHIH
jgi:hypothetical protein